MDALVDFLLKPRRFPDSLLAQRDKALGFFRRAPGFVRRALVFVLERVVVFAVLVVVVWGGCLYLSESNYLWIILEKIGIHKSYTHQHTYPPCIACGLG